MDGLVAVVFVAARWMRGGIRRRSFSACSHLRTIAALLVSQCPLTRRSFKRALGLSLFVYFLVFVSDIFCSPKCSALHLAFASARLVAFRRFVAGWALEFEEDLCGYAYDLYVFV